MSRHLLIPTVPLRVVKVVESGATWEIRDVEGGDVMLVKKGVSDGQRECDARDFLDALLSVSSARDLVAFVTNYCDPGIDDREYLGIQQFEVAGRPFTTKNYLVRPQSKILLSRVRDFQQVLKQAIRASVRRWRFTRWFDPEDLRIDLELKGTRLQAVCKFQNGAEACLGLIYMEKVAGRMKYGWCCLCGRLFRKTSRHKRKYCTNTCVAQGKHEDAPRSQG